LAIANALQLEAPGATPVVPHSVFLANSVLDMCTICYFATFDQNSDIAVNSATKNFYKRAMFGDQTTFSRCNLDLWHLTLHICQ